MSCRVISQRIFSNHMFTYLWNIYKNLVFKSVGLNISSLLGSSSSSSSVDASSFACFVILSLYLTLNFVISSLIVGTFKVCTRDILKYCFSFNLCVIFYQQGARSSAVDWGTALQAGRSQVRFPVVSLESLNGIIIPAALWSWGRLSL